MMTTENLTLEEAEDLQFQVCRAIDTLRSRVYTGSQNVTSVADTGRPAWGMERITQSMLEGALQDVQEAVGNLLPHLPA